jgi:predicted Zn-dependent protease
MTARFKAPISKLCGCLFVFGFLAGCANTPNDQKVTLSFPSVTTPQEHSAAAERENRRILTSYGGVYQNPRLQKVIEKIVARLVASSERPDLKYQVTILNSSAINAFALPNGHLFITRGLTVLANDEAELASVLAHEMGHVIARHAAIREEQAKQTAIISKVVNEVLSDPEAGALALAKSKLALASFSRAQEFEADGIGVGIAARAGYDPFGAARFLSDMQRNADLKSSPTGKEVSLSDFLSSHPATPEREKNALVNARQFGGPGTGESRRDEYLNEINGTIYGDDPSEGFVRGRQFVHPKLGFTFVAPPDFSLDNTAQAVLGLKEGGDEALRLDVVSVPAEQSLADFLKSGWIENVDPATIEQFSVNGFSAATAIANAQMWSFRLYVLRFGSDVYRFIFAVKSPTALADKAFRESMMSFRRLSLAEREKIHPMRLEIVAVRPGDTQEKLARAMSFVDRPLVLFRVLNGLSANDHVKPGQRVKIVVQ